MKKETIFISYNFRDKDAVAQYYTILSKYLPKRRFYFYDNIFHFDFWGKEIRDAVKESDRMILFAGNIYGETQKKEKQLFVESHEDYSKNLILFELESFNVKEFKDFGSSNSIRRTTEKKDETASVVVDKVSTLINTVLEKDGFKINDDLPLNPHLFDYEKTIIKSYIYKSQLEKFVGLNFEEGIPKTLKEEDLEKLVGIFKDKIEDFIVREKIRKELLSLLYEVFTENEERELLKENVSDKGINKENLKDKVYAEVLNIGKLIAEGLPPRWPEVKRELIEGEIDKNPLPETEIGKYRKHSAHVLCATLSDYHDKHHDFCLNKLGFKFPEAGPRKYIFHPEDNFTVGILVSGGIAPGINAVIDGITQRHFMYAEKHGYTKRLAIWGLKNGFKAFDKGALQYDFLGPNEDYDQNGYINTSRAVSEGGSIINTSRYEDLLDFTGRIDRLEDIVRRIENNNIRILYVIGGDGSMKAAHAISNVAANKNYELSVVGIPKTMDNDILWVWQTFGFLSAVEKAREFIEQLAVEVNSNPRLGVVQLFGSDSGFVVSHAVSATKTGICDLALIPENPFSMAKITEYLREKFKEKQRNHGLIIMAETAIPTDAMQYVDETRKDYIEVNLSEKEKEAIRNFDELRSKKRRIQGQTDDHLRTAGLKIVSRGIQKLDPGWGETFRVLTNEPRHLLRAIPPSTIDIIFGSRLGTLAVDNAMGGYHDFMISQWLTEYVLVPLKLTVLGRKRLPPKGIFWKTVLSKTGQPENLT